MNEKIVNGEQTQFASEAKNEEIAEVAESEIPSAAEQAEGAATSCEQPKENLGPDHSSATEIKRIFQEAAAEFWATLEPNLKGLLHESSEQSAEDVEQFVRKSVTELGQTLKPDFERVLSVPDQVNKSLNGVFSKIFDRIEDPQGRFAFNLQRSLLKGLLSIYDLLQDLEGNTEKELSDKEHRANYGTIRMQMFQLFAFNDIKPIIPEAGAKMDAQFHRAVEVVLTGEPEEDNCIEKCIRDGFIYGSIVLRPAEVIVRKYSTEAVLTNDSTVDEN